MTVVHAPGFASISALLDWCETLTGRVVRIVAYKGGDGLVRGSVVLEPAS